MTFFRNNRVVKETVSAGRRRPPHLPRLIIAAALLLAAAICAISAAAIPHKLPSQQAADAWRGESEMEFAQLSVFMPLHEGLSVAKINEIRGKLEEKLAAASLTAEVSGRLWVDCWSNSSTLSVSGKLGSTTASTLAVGGDFFTFHPYRLISGSYISSDDLMQDRVILDRTLAWKLFGAVDLAGMSVTINEKPYYIAAVIDPDDDKYSRLTNAAEGLLFVSFEALGEMNYPSDNRDIDLATCYELVLPNIVRGFAADTLAACLPQTNGLTVENSRRFSLGSLTQVLADYGSRVMRSDGVLFPPWENSARCAENHAALLALAALLLAIFPAGLAAAMLASAAARTARRAAAALRARFGR